MRTILEIYFGLNLLLTGFDMSDSRREGEKPIALALAFTLNVALGLPLLIVAFVLVYRFELLKLMRNLKVKIFSISLRKSNHSNSVKR